MDINESLKSAKQKLQENNIDEREARLLLAFSLGIKSDELIKYFEITENQFDSFMKLVEKRCHHVPFAYLTGHKEFMKLIFFVNENVLIPRDDTEVLVEEVIDIINNDLNKDACVLDMCTGSGCIAVSIARYTNAKVYAVDKSQEAINVAIDNAKENETNVEFVASDLFAELNSDTKFDLIVSNPPYIKTNVIDTLQEEVKDNEPSMALDGGDDGLFFYRKITKDAKEFLKPNGYLCFEIGFDQAESVSNILKENGYKDIRVIKDYSMNDRVVIAKYS